MQRHWRRRWWPVALWRGPLSAPTLLGGPARRRSRFPRDRGSTSSRPVASMPGHAGSVHRCGSGGRSRCRLAWRRRPTVRPTPRGPRSPAETPPGHRRSPTPGPLSASVGCRPRRPAIAYHPNVSPVLPRRTMRPPRLRSARPPPRSARSADRSPAPLSPRRSPTSPATVRSDTDAARRCRCPRSPAAPPRTRRAAMPPRSDHRRSCPHRHSSRAAPATAHTCRRCPPSCGSTPPAANHRAAPQFSVEAAIRSARRACLRCLSTDSAAASPTTHRAARQPDS